MTDNELLDAIRSSLASDGRLLSDVQRLGHASLCWRDIDREVTMLLIESGESVVAMRSTSEGRHYTFSTLDTTVDVAVIPANGHVSLIGWIDPVSELDVNVVVSTGEVIATAPVDDRGRFRVVVEHRGPVRLEFTHQPLVSTEWFSTA